MAAPSAVRLTEQFFSPQKVGASQGSGAIPAEFLTPPPQTFGAQLFGGGAVSDTLDTLDIKPVILAPSPPAQSSNDTKSDDNEIEILMDDMLKDLESNPSGFCSEEGVQADDSSAPTQRSLGLFIRKDIFATPKKGQPDVVDLGVSWGQGLIYSPSPGLAANVYHAIWRAASAGAAASQLQPSVSFQWRPAAGRRLPRLLQAGEAAACAGS
jgi:hypothetical protein